VTSSTAYDEGPWPRVVSHRGGAALAPESTALAFATSLAHGVDHVETDLRVTADGVAVAFHDERVDRVTGLRGPVRDLPWESLARTVVRVPGVPGEGRVMTIEDVLGTFPHVRLAVDLKTPDGVAPLARALRRTRSAHRVCVAGAFDGWLAEVRAACDPAPATALGWGALSALVLCARTGTRPPAALATGRHVHLPWSWGRLPLLADDVLRRRVVERADDLGVRVVAWTVDDPARARALLDDGVSAVITDRPDVLAGLVRPARPTSAGPQLHDLEVG
jgi:glycerophosphoryl diester phosphodiesterase